MDILKDNKGKAGIYRWTYIEAGKSYVGSTLDFNDRFSRYFIVKFLERSTKERQSFIYRALLKQGYSAFRLDILEYCDASELKEREQYYFDNLEHRYNILQFAHTSHGYKHSPESLGKLRQKTANRTHVPKAGLIVDIVDSETGL